MNPGANVNFCKFETFKISKYILLNNDVHCTHRNENWIQFNETFCFLV